MQELNTSKYPSEIANKIDLQKIFNVLLHGKWIIISVTSFISIIAIIYSLLLPNLYVSKALIAPVDASNNIERALGGYSNLAGLAGINLPSGSDEGNSLEALQKISTLSFFEKKILSNIYLPDLIAIKSWNSKTNTITYDKNLYDTNTNTWIRDYSYPQQLIPSAQESFRVFKENHLNIVEDRKTGFITLSIKHQSPYIAMQWVELIYNEINSFYRQKDKLQSEKTVSYLNEQILITDLYEIKQVLAQLLQEEVKTLALIEASESYVFNYIDPPAVMEQKSEPKRALICILSAILGGMLGVIIVFIRHILIKKN
jgi:hypothetical protein